MQHFLAVIRHMTNVTIVITDNAVQHRRIEVSVRTREAMCLRQLPRTVRCTPPATYRTAVSTWRPRCVLSHAPGPFCEAVLLRNTVTIKYIPMFATQVAALSAKLGESVEMTVGNLDQVRVKERRRAKRNANGCWRLDSGQAGKLGSLVCCSRGAIYHHFLSRSCSRHDVLDGDPGICIHTSWPSTRAQESAHCGHMPFG
ncbi:hypothetical protein F5X68DRAFT_201766 [Plectosphaerella plurivora]|uniref:Uncharacterized protein n=1 Tax=Plectosphaerella plurivora TaxID=936078 RepID=A0A9P8VF99_9PEZI|nr:hypothetical protein F5X68DRAFT_201766 [Plectosphaerella plurivora]